MKLIDIYLLREAAAKNFESLPQIAKETFKIVISGKSRAGGHGTTFGGAGFEKFIPLDKWEFFEVDDELPVATYIARPNKFIVRRVEKDIDQHVGNQLDLIFIPGPNLGIDLDDWDNKPWWLSHNGFKFIHGTPDVRPLNVDLINSNNLKSSFPDAYARFEKNKLFGAKIFFLPGILYNIDDFWAGVGAAKDTGTVPQNKGQVYVKTNDDQWFWWNEPDEKWEEKPKDNVTVKQILNNI